MVDEQAQAAAAAGTPLPSPVPGDDDLWDVEQPFTAFGQFGVDEMDLRVFDQDTWWVDRFGRPHRLEQMDNDYRRNVLAFLIDSADQRWRANVRREVITAFTDALVGKASYEVLARDAGAPAVRDLDPLTWLEATPLVRRLRALTPEGAALAIPEDATESAP